MSVGLLWRMSIKWQTKLKNDPLEDDYYIIHVEPCSTSSPHTKKKMTVTSTKKIYMMRTSWHELSLGSNKTHLSFTLKMHMGKNVHTFFFFVSLNGKSNSTNYWHSKIYRHKICTNFNLLREDTCMDDYMAREEKVLYEKNKHLMHFALLHALHIKILRALLHINMYKINEHLNMIVSRTCHATTKKKYISHFHLESILLFVMQHVMLFYMRVYLK